MLAVCTTICERCVRAVQSKDARFDGWFFTAVLTTGIYCRPSCPVRAAQAPRTCASTPAPAAAQQAGFRACKRCRPDASPGSPEWNERADLVARAMRLIADGVVDREGVPGLAARLGYSTRQIERQLLAELGAGPLALARAQRAQTARLLIETTALPMARRRLRGRVRQHPPVQRHRPRGLRPARPTELRDRVAARRARRPPPGTLSLRLPFRAPLCPDNLFGHLAATAVPGVEEWRDGAYRRTLRLPHGHGIVALHARRPTTSRCRLALDRPARPRHRDQPLPPAARPGRRPGRRRRRCSRADPVLAPAGRQGARAAACPRTVDAAEFARARGARPAGVHRRGPHPRGAAGRRATASRSTTPPAASPTSSRRRRRSPRSTRPRSPCPQARRATSPRWSPRWPTASSTSAPGSDWAPGPRAARRRCPGIGPWTVEIIAMRAPRRPRRVPRRPTSASAGRPGARPARHPGRADRARAAAWRPWRAYAVQYLWADAATTPSTAPAA